MIQDRLIIKIINWWRFICINIPFVVNKIAAPKITYFYLSTIIFKKVHPQKISSSKRFHRSLNALPLIASFSFLTLNRFTISLIVASSISLFILERILTSLVMLCSIFLSFSSPYLFVIICIWKCAWKKRSKVLSLR